MESILFFMWDFILALMECVVIYVEFWCDCMEWVVISNLAFKTMWDLGLPCMDLVGKRNLQFFQIEMGIWVLPIYME